MKSKYFKKLKFKNNSSVVKIAQSLLTLLFLVAVAGTVTWSAWSDEESSDENTITAGTLDLQIGGNDLDGSAKVTVPNSYPGMAEAIVIDSYINNAGSVAMNSGVTFAVTSVQDNENGLLEPEVDASDDASTGELCGQLEVKVQADLDDSGVLGDDAGDIIYGWGSLSALASAGNQSIGNLEAVSGVTSSRLFKMEYRVPATADNTIMSDICSFDIDFVANQ